MDDILSPPNCLYGAFICSTKPLARVKGVSLKNHPRLVQVPDVITVKDIPKEGKNIGNLAMFGAEPLFADDLTRCCGDIIALVVIPHFLVFYKLGNFMLVATKCSCSYENLAGCRHAEECRFGCEKCCS